MELAFIIYLVEVILPAIAKFTGILGVCLLFFGVFVLCIVNWFRLDYCSHDEEEHIKENISKAFKNTKLYVVSGLLLFVNALIPSKETSYVMIAAYGVQSVVQNERVQEFAGNSLSVLEKYMSDYLKEEDSEVSNDK